jgi:hypothetical protein
MTNFLTLETLRKAIKIASVVVILGLVGKLTLVAMDARAAYNETRKLAICPSLFSIARSSRDTLIVMKAEPLCDVYMLDNLK